MDKEDYAIFCEDYMLTEDPIKGALLNGKKSMEQMTDGSVKKYIQMLLARMAVVRGTKSAART
ncbi:MAG: hypothetical protein HFI19_15415 [Lachnospiraceae bacterium]|jgi:hypothetical protein|uniref:hypothetical protein n=1 Tax=Candidatus Merdisoma sp. JLR.KK006 TaxID=3112626 RepID=UPI002FF30338|nr:hypothetical protein [Lachnospiraceae bacterium]